MTILKANFIELENRRPSPGAESSQFPFFIAPTRLALFL